MDPAMAVMIAVSTAMPKIRQKAFRDNAWPRSMAPKMPTSSSIRAGTGR